MHCIYWIALDEENTTRQRHRRLQRWRRWQRDRAHGHAKMRRRRPFFQVMVKGKYQMLKFRALAQRHLLCIAFENENIFVIRAGRIIVCISTELHSMEFLLVWCNIQRIPCGRIDYFAKSIFIEIITSLSCHENSRINLEFLINDILSLDYSDFFCWYFELFNPVWSHNKC